jgi:hypothetical protein
MKTIPNLFLAASALALLISLASCGKKKDEDTADDGPQSTPGKLLESVQKTVDEANERTRKIKESTGEDAE